MEKNKYQELSRCPWTSSFGWASGAEMAPREEALIVQTLRSATDYRSLMSPMGACPGGHESQREKRGQPLRYGPVTLAQLTADPQAPALAEGRGWPARGF